MPVRGNGVDPKDALAADGRFQVRRRSRLAHGVVGVGGDVVVDHHVAQSVGVADGPRQQVVFQDWAVVGEVNDLLTGLNAVLDRHFHFNDPRFDVSVGPVVAIL